MTGRTEGETPILAAVDLGSNSFHMVIARFVGHDLQVMDKLREPVRLAEGLDAERNLSDTAVDRAIVCLEQFAERIRHLEPRHIRAVGTNTFRRARRAEAFRARAEAALGAPIEILAGHEEARLIYLGVAQTSPPAAGRRLVVDIGGGSTELIIGNDLESELGFSRQLGCVSFTRQFFAAGEITQENFQAAQTAAALELRPIRESLRARGWTDCLGSSGTVIALGSMLSARGWGEDGITLAGLEALRGELVSRGRIAGWEPEGVRSDRWLVLPGGLAVLIACFKALRIEAMQPAPGALREGVLYDLIGRMGHRDARHRSIRRLVNLYHVDLEQAARVEAAAHQLLAGVQEGWALPADQSRRFLSWAATLHEIGLAVSYSDYHLHGAYLLANSELPGFSRDEQTLLAALVSNHRRRLRLELLAALPGGWGELGLRLSLILRLAVLLYRSRHPSNLPDSLGLSASDRTLRLSFPVDWQDAHPLTAADLRREADFLETQGILLRFDAD